MFGPLEFACTGNELQAEEAYVAYGLMSFPLSLSPLNSMLTGRLLYHSFDDRAFRVMERKGGVQHVLSVYEQWGLILPPACKELICWMLHPDANQRPTLEEILQHSWLKQSASALPSEP